MLKYIQPCIKCGSELRFPLDRGVLIVKCPKCSHSFKVDPNNPSIYYSGKFDYQIHKNNKKKFNDVLNTFFDYLYIPVDIAKFLYLKFTSENLTLQKAIPILLLFLLLLNIQKCVKEIKKIQEKTLPKPPMENKEKDDKQDWYEEPQKPAPYQI